MTGEIRKGMKENMEGTTKATSKVRIMDYTDDFYETVASTGRKLVLYGMGAMAEYVYPHLTDVAYVCDRRGDRRAEFHGVPVITPGELERLEDKLIILVSVKKLEHRAQIKALLSSMDIDAMVFEFCHNKSFPTFQMQERAVCKEKDIKKVHIVCYPSGWILEKFAKKLQEELGKKGIQADIGSSVDMMADINHHMAYYTCEILSECNDTVMITHVDSVNKLNLVKHLLKRAKMGICMSRDTMNQLTAQGVPREKLCYINPAQDGVIKPRKYVLGLTYHFHDDNRKRSTAILDICDKISPDFFEFKIMGDGWEKLVESMREKGFTVTYYPEFDYDVYVKLMPTLDYYLYWGFDEGSMGYLDALAAGVGTIVTPQGYHLDTRCGLTYPCRTIPDFIETLLQLEAQKRKITDAVADWTWENYAQKHIEVWKYILGRDDVFGNKHKYEDGIFSVMCIDS